MAIELKASKRLVLGKKVKALRRQGNIPAHLFGPAMEPESIQIEASEFKRILAEAGRTQLVHLQMEGQQSPRVVMVREVQVNNLKGEVLHVDFYQVNMAETIKVDVPIVFVGESAAAKAKGNALVQELNDLTIECLPGNIPSTIEADVSPLVTADQMVRVRDIAVPTGVRVLNDEDVVIARIEIEKVEREPEKPAVEAAAEAAAEEQKEPEA